jgi:hypothetical protein
MLALPVDRVPEKWDAVERVPVGNQQRSRQAA